MRESIGGAWIFSIVIVFIVIFISYLAVSINYAKAFRVKNSIVLKIEQNEGLSSNAQDEIKTYLDNNGYYVYGECDKDEVGIQKMSGSNNKYRFCVRKNVDDTNQTFVKTYYRVKVFFRIDLPVIGSLLTFPVTGETKAVYFANDNI